MLTEGQQEALDIAVFRYKHNLKYTVISGYAGVGKSYTVSHIIAEINPERPVFCAFTGQACKVLQQKGNKNVLTLHKLLYNFIPKGDGTYIQTKRPHLDYNFIVVDECSMVPQKMIDDLLSYKDIYVIFLGDPFQLPSISGEDNKLLENPHAFLTEIMRQALDNEIIKFSMDIREGNPIPLEYKGKNVQIYQKDKLNTGMLTWADQILVATNATRVAVNNQMREIKGYSGEPKVGDKIICLKNNWNIFDDDGNALVNGTVGFIQNIQSGFFPLYSYFKVKGNKLPYYKISLNTVENTNFNVIADTKLFNSDKTFLTESQKYQISKNKSCKRQHIVPPEDFAFAYAITAHKSQGSSYNNVLIIEEKFPFSELEHRRWLYTAITRAESKAVIIRK